MQGGICAFLPHLPRFEKCIILHKLYKLHTTSHPIVHQNVLTKTGTFIQQIFNALPIRMCLLNIYLLLIDPLFRCSENCNTLSFGMYLQNEISHFPLRNSSARIENSVFIFSPSTCLSKNTNEYKRRKFEGSTHS